MRQEPLLRSITLKDQRIHTHARTHGVVMLDEKRQKLKHRGLLQMLDSMTRMKRGGAFKFGTVKCCHFLLCLFLHSLGQLFASPKSSVCCGCHDSMKFISKSSIARNDNKGPKLFPPF
ncbi:hypothetical protein NC653_000833 [Populus alba x Populus x berolinensis]|uniref:Uncharacterized protein n=2 Tax=Populus alba x Populus x berolinensis TaxID=444605 RepID=A0AAD6RJN5_9ROSI|nr:hypothetical protein NC653_000833 [Populus alba x Populus x berolinensis]